MGYVVVQAFQLNILLEAYFNVLRILLEAKVKHIASN